MNPVDMQRIVLEVVLVDALEATLRIHKAI
jgi:hypothetical protein